ncbi:GAF and ANTAR domain-containing protein [Actinoplanes sp. NPDC051411]|uniref:GAF and ANTAR domain-containing protein n=1 Tax=Actinoplanes sp. NPDC051411 TaxID=3155522 RepID=UPI00342E03D3
MTDSDFLDPLDAFGQLARIKFNETDVDGVLHQIATLAKRTVPGATEVSVTLVREKGPHTAAFTGEMAVELDETQYQRGHGPCLDAAESGETLLLADMRREIRWPELARRALEIGCHSSLSIGLPVHEQTTGGLNIYGGRAHAFDDDAIGLAQAFSGYAAVALANAHLYDTTAALAMQMQRAMETRAVIEQAKGIIMADRRCGADEAFHLLTKLSQDTNRKLRDIAAILVAQAAERRPGKR